MGAVSDELLLAREWRTAHDRVRQLAQTDPYLDFTAGLEPLPPLLLGRATDALSDPVAQRCLGILPHRWAYVDLDQLVVWQRHVNLTYAQRYRSALSDTLSDEVLLEVAIGDAESQAPVHITRSSGNRFTFASPSTGFGVLASACLDPALVRGPNPFGYVSAVLCISVGFGLNFMTAVHFQDRLVLTNGTHRAYMLRRAGVTHVPCLVVQAKRRDDLQLINLPTDGGDAERALNSVRPALLRDYFNEDLVKVLRVPTAMNVLQVELKFEQTKVVLA
jgi:hypothetical protein